MSSLEVTARFTIHEGELSEFKTLAERCMASVREKDTGTLQYDGLQDMLLERGLGPEGLA